MNSYLLKLMFYASLWKSNYPLPLALFLIAVIGCGQAERERRKAVKKNLEELGKAVEQYSTKKQEAADGSEIP